MVAPPALWAHQRAVLARLVAGHLLLLWAMGTGKTAALIVAGEMVGGRQLWITLGMLVEQTRREILRFRPGVKVQVIRSGRDQVDPTADVVLVSYDLMRALPVWKQLFTLRWASAVCDEGHALARPASVRTRAFYGYYMYSPGALFRRCDRVWIATGTPVLNAPDDLWPHLSRLFLAQLPGLKTREEFLSRYCVLVRRTFGWVVVGGRNLQELSEILTQCASRLTLSDVVDLPPLLVRPLPVEISAAHRREMDEALSGAQLAEVQVILDQIEGGEEAAWQRLQAMLLPLASARRVTALAKAPAAAEIIKAELEGGADRVVVFGSHVEALRFVAEKLVSFDARLLVGDTPPAQRQQALLDFEKGTARVLVCNTSIGGFGLNLQHASRCLMLDLPWTPAALDQAVARLHRAGQARHVHVSLLAVARSVDERVADVLARKRHIVSEITEGVTS